VSIQQERSTPFELIVTTESGAGVTDATLAEISKIAGVKGATPILQIPVQINMGEYRAELTLTGIQPTYVPQSGLPEESVMPYIVLNEAACKLFSKDSEATDETTEAPKIDWLTIKATILTGEESLPVPSKVFGVMESEKDDEPVAYISLNTAKALLKISDQTTICRAAYVRIENIRRAESVSRALGVLRLTVVNADTELQAKWDTETKEMAYLIVVGSFCLVCSAVLLAAWRRILLDEQKDAYAMLHWLGMKKKDIARIFAIQSTLLSLIGVGIGTLTAIILPSFLPQEIL
jgi:ABC-type lipoprotein release transport system permease subunit